MTSMNFRSLLFAITIEQLKAYLVMECWTEELSHGRLNFTKEIEQGELQTLFVPADQAHPKFRSLLQNLVFSLSVTQGREPVEIASDIYALQVVTPDETPGIADQLHEVASLVRGLAQECNATERAKGMILELARFLLATKSLSIPLTSKLADELWQVARTDQAYLPSATSEWLEANAKRLSSK